MRAVTPDFKGAPAIASVVVVFCFAVYLLVRLLLQGTAEISTAPSLGRIGDGVRVQASNGATACILHILLGYLDLFPVACLPACFSTPLGHSWGLCCSPLRTY